MFVVSIRIMNSIGDDGGSDSMLVYKNFDFGNYNVIQLKLIHFPAHINCILHMLFLHMTMTIIFRIVSWLPYIAV